MIVATNTQVRVLRVLMEHPGASCKDIAGLLGMSPAGADCHLRALEKKGMAVRHGRPAAGRTTEAGEADATPAVDVPRLLRIEAAARAVIAIDPSYPHWDELRAALA